MTKMIPIVTAAEISVQQTKSADDNKRSTDELLRAWPFRKTQIASKTLETKLTELLQSMDGVLTSIPSKLGEFSLESMTLDVEISAEGEVSLLGTGGKIGGKGGLSFVLKRKSE